MIDHLRAAGAILICLLVSCGSEGGGESTAAPSPTPAPDIVLPVDPFDPLSTERLLFSVLQGVP